jgi:hypothetical protein
VKSCLAFSALSGLAVALLAPLTLSPPAHAGGESCEGLPATVVGTPGATVTGTDGPDVIVSAGAVEVRALGGDDVICTTASVAPAPGAFDPAVRVLAGSGDDVVDRRGDTGPGATGRVYP